VHGRVRQPSGSALTDHYGGVSAGAPDIHDDVGRSERMT
jgi:hypothetical protein